MHHRWLALLQPLTLALAVGALACTQPRKACTAGPGPAPFAVKYTRTDDGKSCETVPGEIVGLEKYNAARADNPEKEDFTKAKLAIQSYTLGCLANYQSYPPGTCPETA